jgi:hypothetical protein
MTKPTFNDLQQAFLAHRRANGKSVTHMLLTTFGAVSGDGDFDLESIPESKWSAAIAALKDRANDNWMEGSTTTQDTPTATGDLDADKIYRRWNACKRAPRAE